MLVLPGSPEKLVGQRRAKRLRLDDLGPPNADTELATSTVPATSLPATFRSNRIRTLVGSPRINPERALLEPNSASAGQGSRPQDSAQSKDAAREREEQQVLTT
jgi:hypothetical protein